jgi:hypothetical protein
MLVRLLHFSLLDHHVHHYPPCLLEDESQLEAVVGIEPLLDPRQYEVGTTAGELRVLAGADDDGSRRLAGSVGAIAAGLVEAPTRRSGALVRFLIFMNTLVVPPASVVANVHGWTISRPFFLSLWANAVGAAIAAARSA